MSTVEKNLVRSAYEEADCINDTILKIASMKDKLILDTIGVGDSASTSEDGVFEVKLTLRKIIVTVMKRMSEMVY